jgi:quinol-cytochrome oxidoreductase complex cytochrome b subunit
VFTASCRGRYPEDPYNGRPSIPVYPDLSVRLGALACAVAALVVTLACLSPRALGAPASLASATTAGARPSWYLAWLHGLLRLCPSELLGVTSARFIASSPVCAIAIASVWPFLVRWGSRVTLVLAWLALGAWLGLTVYARF